MQESDGMRIIRPEFEYEGERMICASCGQLQGIPEYDDKLWELHSRRKDGRQNIEGLVFDSEWLQENIMDEHDEEVLDLTMSRDMHNRGLCPTCGRPDLAGKTEEDFYSEQDALEMQDMWAQEVMERRMGC
jgi:hypothetical protein